MAAGDPRATTVYQTIGAYLGYALLDYREFYDLEHLLLLGRVMTGPGGDVIIDRTRAVLRAEDPDANESITIHSPSEREKRHGQAVAAASLPALERRREPTLRSSEVLDVAADHIDLLGADHEVEATDTPPVATPRVRSG